MLVIAGLLALLSVALKAALLAADVFPFNADEAIVALMARHILRGEWPAFFYGQAYLGSLDPGLVAGGFAAFGERVLVIRAIQTLLYAGTVFTGTLLSWRLLHSRVAALATGLLLAVPTVNLTLYSTVSIGGYGEALLLGQSLLLVTLALLERRRPALYGAWGLLAGLAFWTFGLTLVYILPAGVALAWNDVRRSDRRGRLTHWGLAALGAAAGMAPWLGWAILHSPSRLIAELLGSAIASASPASLPLAWLEHARNLLLLGGSVILGFRPPWDTRWLALPLLPFALAIWSCVFLHAMGVLRHRDAALSGRWMIAGVAVTTVAGFILTPFGADPSGRYFLPLAYPMAFFAGSLAADLLPRVGRRWVAGMVALLLAYNLWGTLDCARRTPPGLTTQFDPVARIDTSAFDELIALLEANGEDAGYANYWIAYPLAFLSEERLIFVPQLPYHTDFRYTDRDNRYPPYNAMVAESYRAAYITTNHPALDDRLRAEFTRLGVEFSEATVGGFHVFYRLSDKVTREAIEIPAEGS
jgi:4-amino-4-deoxy-L-arabinose transferase-like glycosyltransferase